MVDLTQKELKFYHKIIIELKKLSDSQEKMKLEEITNAQRVLGKKYDLLNIKTKEIEKIVKINFDKNFDLENYIHIAEKFFSSNNYHYGACAIIILQKCKYYFKDIENAKLTLQKINKFYKLNLLDSWPFTDSICLKVIKPMLNIHGKDIEKIIFVWSSNNKNIWLQRASIVSFIKYAKNHYEPEYWFTYLDKFIENEHLMIQKACGWFLREYFVIFPTEVEKYIRKKYKRIARIIIRTAFEKMDKNKRKLILKELK